MTVIFALQDWVQVVQFESDLEIEILGPVAQHGDQPEWKAVSAAARPGFLSTLWS